MAKLDARAGVVTGAGTGIGQASAIALASEGAAVALMGRREGPLRETAAAIEDAGGKALVLALDIVDAGAVQAAMDQVLGAFGRIDVLVNSAGVNITARSWTALSPDGWRQIIDTNLTGTFNCCKAVLPAMRAQRSGTIVNISSLAGKRASLLGGAAYAASKFGVAGLTQSLLLEERQNGIRACSVFPGEVDTPFVRKRPFIPSPEVRAALMQAEDVAAVVLMVVTMPARAMVHEVVLEPTVQRDPSIDRVTGTSNPDFDDE